MIMMMSKPDGTLPIGIRVRSEAPFCTKLYWSVVELGSIPFDNVHQSNLVLVLGLGTSKLYLVNGGEVPKASENLTA